LIWVVELLIIIRNLFRLSHYFLTQNNPYATGASHNRNCFPTSFGMLKVLLSVFLLHPTALQSGMERLYGKALLLKLFQSKHKNTLLYLKLFTVSLLSTGHQLPLAQADYIAKNKWYAVTCAPLLEVIYEYTIFNQVANKCLA